jgi:sulfofructose kinase
MAVTDHPPASGPANADRSAGGRSGRVLCVGHAAHDSVYRIESFPARPTKVPALALDRSIGGMAANAACAISALGGRAIYWGPLGDDQTAALIRAEFAQAGVDASGAIRVVGAQSSQSAIIVDATGERLIISQRGTALEAGAQDLVARPIEADVVLVDVRWNAGAELAARRGRSLGLPVVLDGEMGNAALLRRLVPLADHLIFSEPGFAEWIGRPVAMEAVADDLAALVAAGATLAAVTHGERGVVFCIRGRCGHLAAVPVKAVETLGAGDVFHGAYSLALAEGSSLEAALRFAAAAAALKCSRSGGRAGLPHRAEVDALARTREPAISG